MAENCPEEKQYQSNIGNHNQAINYSNIISLPTLTRKSEDKKVVTGTRPLQLQLSNNICKPVFTGVPIKGEDGQALMVKLIDRQSGRVVTSDPEASARVLIVGLQADFCVLFGDSWTREEFKSTVVTNEGMKPLLTGNVALDLIEGIGYVGIVGFSHTKKWKMKCAYRLGAIVADDDIGTQIREGFTESFVVKDRRLNLNQKHNPPTLSDKVWRLHGIAKDGPFHQRLSDINIKTVEGFLEKLNSDSQKLRDVFGKGMSALKWEALIAHARTCKVDERLHLKSTTNFNEIDFHQQVILFDGSPSQSNTIISSLSPIKKRFSEKQISLCQKRNELDFVLVNNDLAFFDESPGLCNNICLPKSPIQESLVGGKSLISLVTDEPYSPRPVAPSREIVKLDPSISSVWNDPSMSSIVSSWREPEHVALKPVDLVLNDELFKPNDHHEGHKHEKPSNCSSQMTEPINWEMLPTFQPWFDPLPFSAEDVPFDTRGIILESSNNPQKEGNGPSSQKQPLTDGGDFLIPISNELSFFSFDNDSTKPAVSFTSMESSFIKPWTSPELSRNFDELYFPQAAVSSPNLLGMDSSSYASWPSS